MPPENVAHQRISSLIASHPVLLFMKGNREAPQCGFSATVIRILDSLLPEFETYDVLSDPEVRTGIKEFSSWPTIPQLYVGGEFLGGCDIVQDLYASGELHTKLGVERPEAHSPSITLTDAAAAAVRGALGQAGDAVLHLSIDARFRAALTAGPRSEGGLEITANGISVAMDPLTAQRAEGAVIDAVDTPQGPAFRIDNPNAA